MGEGLSELSSHCWAMESINQLDLRNVFTHHRGPGQQRLTEKQYQQASQPGEASGIADAAHRAKEHSAAYRPEIWST